jgi:GTP-binding protein
MQISKAKFLMSNTDAAKCPKRVHPEYAFIGRSNVGKSSLINMLTGRQKLAKISGKPGKTQLINHFIINDNWYLVDLPGYGYAKVAKTKRAEWQEFVLHYIKQRENLICLFVLIDSRIPPQKIDMDFLALLGEMGIPFVLLMTKTEKLSKNQLKKNIQNIKDAILSEWEEMPEYYLTSAVSEAGKEEILRFISENNKLFKSVKY